MPHYTVRLEARQLERRWSYQWYQLADSAAHAVSRNTGVAFLRTFQHLHSTITRISRVTAARTPSVADPTPPRETSRKALHLFGTLQPVYLDLADPDIVDVAIILNLASNGGPAREMAIRGVPDNMVRRNAAGVSVLNPVMESAINELVDRLADPVAPALVRAQMPPQPGPFQWRAVKQLEPVAGSENLWTKVVTIAAHGVTAGQRVLFGGEIDCNVEGLKGAFVVLDVPTTDSLVIATKYRGIGNVQPVRNVRVRLLNYQFFPIVSRLVAGGQRISGFKEFGKRDTGSGSTKRGRRRGKSCRT